MDALAAAAAAAGHHRALPVSELAVPPDPGPPT